MKSTKVKYAGMSLTITAVVIALFILINVLAPLLTDRFNLKFDLTSAGLFEISGQTADILRDIDEDVRLTVLADRDEFLMAGDAYADIGDLLNKYAALGAGSVSLRYLDPDSNPQLASDYEAVTLVRGNVVVESDLRYMQVSLEDLLVLQSNSPVGFQFEQAMTNAVLYVVSEQVSKAVFVSGHGERDNETFLNFLVKNLFPVETVNIEQTDIPADTTLLVICAPASDFTELGVSRLDAYMAGGGNAIYLYDATVTTNERLAQYMSEWGVAFGPYFVLEPTACSPTNPTVIYPRAVDHPATAQVARPQAPYIVGQLLSPIELQFEAKGDLSTAALLTSTDQAYGRSFDEVGSDVYRLPEDTEGPFTLAALTTRTLADDSGAEKNQYLLTVDYSVSAYFDNAYSNELFFSDALQYMNPAVQFFTVPARTLQEAAMSLKIDAGQSFVFMLLLVILLPLAILLLGIMVWLRRRHL